MRGFLEHDETERRLGPGAALAQERGSTLVECAIAMAILAIGMMGIYHTQVVASGSDAFAARMDRATVIARDLLTYLETIPYESDILLNVTPGANDGDAFDTSGNFAGRGAYQEPLGEAYFDFRDDGDTLPDVLMADPEDPCAVTGGTCLFLGYVNPALLGAGGETNRPTLDFNGDGTADFERYWIIEDLAGATGKDAQGLHISVIVRWFEPTVRGHRRVVMSTVRHDPGAMLP